MISVDVLIPTMNRLQSLIMTLSGVALQSRTDLGVIVADQSDEPANCSEVVRSLCKLIEARGNRVCWYHRKERFGIAEQRDFLLRVSSADAVLYLDDDVIMESWVVEKMANVLEEQGCAFVGAFPTQPTYIDDVRPHQQHIEYWAGRVQPEVVNPGDPKWHRATLHTAANLFHVAQGLGLPPGDVRLYKVSWIGACVMYDRRKLLEIGGFSFWRRLPRKLVGEDALVQNILMRLWGGCGIVPSGTYFAEVPSNFPDQYRSRDHHALMLLPEMIKIYAPHTPTPKPDAWKYW